MVGNKHCLILVTQHLPAYPPSDGDVCEWFSKHADSPQQHANRVCAFLCSAFTVALDRLEEIEKSISDTTPGGMVLPRLVSES